MNGPVQAQDTAQALIEEVLAKGNWRMWLVTPFRPNVLGQCHRIHESPMFDGLRGSDKPRLVEKRRLDLPLVINVAGKSFEMKTGPHDETAREPAEKADKQTGQAPSSDQKVGNAYQSGLISPGGTCFVLEANGKARYSGAAGLAGGVYNLPFPSLLLDPFSPAGAPQFMWVKSYFQGPRQK